MNQESCGRGALSFRRALRTAASRRAVAYFGSVARTGSRRIPSTCSSPWRLQYVTVPENCPPCHCTISFTPTAMGALTRRLAPLRDLSSSFAGATCGVPSPSSHITSIRAMTPDRGSDLFSFTAAISAKNRSGLLPVSWASFSCFRRHSEPAPAGVESLFDLKDEEIPHFVRFTVHGERSRRAENVLRERNDDVLA